MKYFNSMIFALIFIVFFQTSLFAELVIDVDPAKVDGDKKEKPENKAVDKKVQEEDVIKFKNKDIMHGKMLSILPGKGISWKCPEVSEDILFLFRNVSKIDLGNSLASLEGNNASILLTNDDILGGTLKSMDDKELVIETKYGGTIKVDSHMVQGIYPGEDNSGLLYSGPNDMNEWSRPEDNSNGEVAVNDGVLKLTGYSAVGRDMKLTDLSKINFKFETAGNSQVQVLFYSDQVRSNPRNCYALYLSSGYIYLQRYGASGRSGNLGNVSSRELRSGKGKVSILTDKKNKKVTLLVNGAILKQWVDTDFPGQGTFLTFVNQSQGIMKISDIEVSQWNGKMPGADSKGEDSKDDSLVFINGDQVTGKLIKISDNTAVFKTEYAELKVPLKRIKQIKTAVGNQRKARRNNGDVRFSFINGDKLTLKLTKLENGKIMGDSENFGKVVLSLNAFKSVEMNIYDDEAAAEEED